MNKHKIETIRKQLGLSQHEFAEQMGVSRTIIWHWESGTRTPSKENLKLLAEFASNLASKNENPASNSEILASNLDDPASNSKHDPASNINEVASNSGNPASTLSKNASNLASKSEISASQNDDFASKPASNSEKPASKDEMTNESKIALFREIFEGREDAYGGFVADKGTCVKENVTNEVIRAHLTGKKRIGRYPLSPEIMDGEGTWWVVADIDENELSIAMAYCEALEHIEIPCYIETSKSKGFHVWVFFSQPVEAKWARGLMNYAIDVVETETEYHIDEIFPKQNTIKQRDDEFGYGNFIYLPLFGGDVSKGRTVFLDPDSGYKPCPDQWELLNSVKKVTPQHLGEVMDANLIDFDINTEPDPKTSVNEGEPTPETSATDVAVLSPSRAIALVRSARDDETFRDDTTDDYTDMLPCVPKMMQGVPEGCRDEVAFTLAKHFRVEKKLPQEATLGILKSWNQKNNPPLERKTIAKKVASAYKGKNGKGYTSFGCDTKEIKQFCDDKCPILKKKEKEKGIDSPYFRKHTFIPKRLADDLMNEHHFIYAGERLHVYREGVFSPYAERFVKQQCREKLIDEARINRINEVIAHISDMNHVETDELNTKQNLINVQNGMYDWIEKELLPHDPKYLSTIRIPVEYEPSTECPTVDNFFASTLPADCIPIAEELFGYCLIPYVRFEKAFMFTGIGANGKSTFLTLLEKFVGSENVSKVPLQELAEHRFKRADLFGKLLNIFADLDARALRSSTYFKTITSGDAIDAERKHRDPFYFRPFSRLVYSANEIPQSPDTSFAYYRRWVIIPFPHRFVGKDADKTLGAKLVQQKELSGLLNRALSGLDRLFTNQEFTKSATVEDALIDYQKQNDTVGAFVSDCVEFGEGLKIERTEVYDAYTTYCKNDGFEAVSRIACYNRIRAYPQVGEKKEPGTRYFTGIRIAQS